MSGVIYKPRTGDEVRRAIRSHPPIYLYSDLVRRMKVFGALPILENMMKRSLDNLILVQDPKNMRSGHWTSLSFHPGEKRAYFFSSYGGKPDIEKNTWIPTSDLIASQQNANVLNDGLKELAYRGWEIHYNQYPYQRIGDHTATCGIWCAAFLNSGLNPDEFNYVITNRGYTPLILYRAFFK